MRKIILLAVLLIGLFISSGQTYEQQSLIPTLEKWLPSQPLESVLSKLEIPYWGIIVSVEERGYYYFLEFLLRKGAHFFVFGMIAIAVFILLPTIKRRFTIAALLTFFIALGDEYHQSLTGGRTPSFQDVLLDMSGALTALLITWVFLKLWKTRRQKAFS